jgi:hypothetical protein
MLLGEDLVTFRDTEGRVGSVRKNHRHHQRAEAGVVHEGIETEAEGFGCLQHFRGGGLACTRPLIGANCGLSKLSFYGGLVDDRPNLPNSLASKFIEHILGEADLSAVYWKAKKLAHRRNVEAQPACDMRRISNENLNVEIEIGYLPEVVFEHCSITMQTERPAIVANVTMNEAAQLRPVLPVEAGNVIAIDVELVPGHSVSIRCRHTKWARGVPSNGHPYRDPGSEADVD